MKPASYAFLLYAFYGTLSDAKAGIYLQNRLYPIKHELHQMASLAVLDPYSNGYGLDLGYTWHINTLWGYEALRVSYHINTPSSLYRSIHDSYTSNLQTTPFYHGISWKASSRMVWKFLYGKNAFLKNYFSRTEWYVLAGVGVAGYTQESSEIFPRKHSLDKTVYGPDLGLGFRWWISKSLSLRAEINSYLYFLDSSVQHDMTFKVGTSFTWNNVYE